tara:strand:+ start:288 stop:419 length:132 start_codon:yes stop_codon:yes gene_type:complete
MADWEETEGKECVCPAGSVIAMASAFFWYRPAKTRRWLRWIDD